MSVHSQVQQMDKEAAAAAAAEYTSEIARSEALGESPIEVPPPPPTPPLHGWRVIGERFRRKLPTKEYTGRGGLKFSYIDARQVQDVLDAVVGPGAWQSDWTVVRSEHPVCARVGIGICGVWKWDCGYSNNPEADQETDRSYEQEPLKAAVSDGFKRAAVQWGIGRFLYGKK